LRHRYWDWRTAGPEYGLRRKSDEHDHDHVLVHGPECGHDHGRGHRHFGIGRGDLGFCSEEHFPEYFAVLLLWLVR
jgi:hypothetical protein